MKLDFEDDAEYQRYLAWDKAHLAEHHAGEEPYCGAIGGRITFELTGTSVGEISSVRCNLCKAKGLDRKIYEECLTTIW